MDDREIIECLQCNDEKGYQALVEKYSGYIGAIVYNATNVYLTTSDMEELAGDVLFKIWKNRMTLEGESLKGLIGTTTRNTCLNALGKNRIPTISIEMDEIQPFRSSDTLHQVYEQKEQIRIVNELVGTLGEPDREIFIRYYYFGEKMSQISEVLSVNLSTVKTKLRRCKEKLRATLCEGGYTYE